jgi:hypothetical protein
LTTTTNGSATTWTDPDVAQLIAHGIPAGQVQDPVLRDVVWKLRGQGDSQEAIWGTWSAIVSKTKLTNPDWAWSEADFLRHWRGAASKQGDPPVVLDPPDNGRNTQDEAQHNTQPRRDLASRAFSRDRLRELPQPEPLITDTLDKRTVILLAGNRGSLKSFTLLSWAASIATGTAWLGRTVADSGRALLVAAEGAYGQHLRIESWELAHRSVPDDALTVIAGPVNLLRNDQVHELCSFVAAGGYKFVALDTLARCTVGGDENSARDMGLAVDAL